VDLASDAELFRTPDGEAFATFAVAEHRETAALRSKSFKSWLQLRFYEERGSSPSSQAVQDALGVLEGRALFDGAEHRVYTRLAEHVGAIYYDLGDEHWRSIKITKDGWDIVSDVPVRFRRSRGMLAQVSPVHGGSLAFLRQFVNVGSDDDWRLLIAWLLGTFRSIGPYPLLVLHGEQGSAKSTTERALRLLTDPNAAPLRAEPREGRDLMIAARNSWVLAFDNLSHLPVWLSDALCRLATGGGFTTRALYSDDEEMIFDAQRPVMLNGIEDLATRGDLLERAIVLYLPRIRAESRQTEKAFWREFDAARGSILGALLDAVVMALRNVDSTELAQLPRMADFATWVTAAAPALGWGPGAFMGAYGGNQETANDLALEASPVAPFIITMVDEGPWQGTATELLARLGERVDEAVRRQKSWPTNPRTLANTLRRLAPTLRTAGVEVGFPPGHKRGRLLTLDRVCDAASPSSPSSPSTLDGAQTGDDGESLRDRRGPWGDDGHHAEDDASELLGTMGDAGDDGSARQSEHKRVVRI
jgi:hypothetical protein